MESFFLEAIKKKKRSDWTYCRCKLLLKFNQRPTEIESELLTLAVSGCGSRSPCGVRAGQISSRLHLLFRPSPELYQFSAFVNCSSSTSHRRFTSRKRLRGPGRGTVWGLSSCAGGKAHTHNGPVNALTWERGGNICPLSHGQGLLRDVT